MQNKVFMTGGSGRLGRELQKYINCDAPTHEEYNVLDPDKSISYKPDIIIHCAAWTNVPGAETKKAECYALNVGATRALADGNNDAYFVYISTEHVKKPVNFYSKTKLWGEDMVKTFSHNYLIIRTLFKERPFPYDYAFVDQYTTGDYLDVIAPLIMNAILKGQTGTIDIGTERKTMFELARRSKPNIKGNSIHDIKDVAMPGDYI